jgi:CubicO group peptidase (beta-lactamase class C family)
MTSTVLRRLRHAAETVKAPDVVFGFTHRGDRSLVTSGTAAEPATGRENLHYELGSVSKTFIGLVLADLAHRGDLRYDTPAVACLPTPPGAAALDTITLVRLCTHTSGLPAMPDARELLRYHLSGRSRNVFAGHSRQRLLDAFHRHGSRGAPEPRWRYSNFGAAVLGHALAHAAGTSYDTLLSERVLRPLGLRHVRSTPGPPGTDAVGHSTGGTPVPPLDAAGFAPAGALRATPHDLLTYLEAHLTPDTTPLASALHAVRATHTAPRPRRAPARTLTWFRHETTHGPVYFHSGATFGHHVYLGHRPTTRTALIGLATRGHTRRHNLVDTAHDLLATLTPSTR